MTDLTVAALVAILCGAAAWSFRRALRRAPASISSARDSMYGRPVSDAGAWHAPLTAGKPSGWVDHHFGSGLDLVGMTAADVVSRVLLSALAFLFGTLLVMGAIASIGAVSIGVWSPMLSLVVAAMAGWTSFHSVAERVGRAQRALRQAANDFVQLVAVGLTTDQSVEEAIRFALDVGGGDAFELLRRQMLAAPQRGVAVWDALEEFARRHGLRELAEFAVSVERQGTQGVSIGETVAALAAGMRARALDELERDADKANANLSGPTVGFVVATVVFLAYPLAQRISEAFGG